MVFAAFDSVRIPADCFVRGSNIPGCSRVVPCQARRRRVARDHRHRHRTIRVYEYRDAATLRTDFRTEVKAVLDSPWQKPSRHSTVPASRRTVLRLGHILPVCSLIAPCPAGAGTVSVRARLSPRTVEERGVTP